MALVAPKSAPIAVLMTAQFPVGVVPKLAPHDAPTKTSTIKPNNEQLWIMAVTTASRDHQSTMTSSILFYQLFKPLATLGCLWKPQSAPFHNGINRLLK